MPETPRFSVSGNDLIDASTGKVLTPNEFNQRATPAEKDAIARELTARSQMANQTSEDQIDETALDEDLATGPAAPPVGSRATMAPSQTAPTPAPESAPIPQSEPLTEAPRRPAGAPPSLPEYLEKARPLNPEFDDREIAIEYRKQFPDANKFYPPPPKDQWIAKAKEVNPEADDAELTAFYTDVYGEPEQPLGFSGTLLEGAKSTGRSLKAAGQAALGYREDAARTAQEQLASPKDPALASLMETLAAKKAELGPDASLWEVGKAVGKSFLENPKGTGLLMTEQLPNSGAMFASAIAGSLIGALSPIPGGAIIGGLLGIFGSNIGLETGQKVIEKAADGTLTPEERSAALTEGAKKGAVISGVDIATFGVTKWLTGTATRAMEAATARVLTEEGVDLTDRAAVQAARNNPAIRQKVTDAQQRAKDGANALGQRVLRGGSEVGLESLGEGVGEYLGEVAATGRGDKMEAFVEAVAGFGQSAAEIGVASAMSRRGEPGGMIEPPPVEPPTATPPSATPLETVAPVLQAQSVDEAIASAAKIVEQPAVTSAQLDTAIGVAPVSPALSYTDAHRSTDQVAFERVVAGRSQGDAVRVIDPKTLPAQTEPTEGMSQEKYDALSVMAQAFGKRLVVFEAGAKLPNGAFWQSQDPSRIYLASSTQGEDAFIVFAHEAMHTMQGTALYESYKTVIRQQVTLGASKVAEIRHGEELSDDQLVEEMAADIGSNELQKPEMWEKVFAHMREQVGDEQAKVEVVGFIDSLKQIIQRIKSMIATRQLTVRGKTLTELYVQDLEKVQDALAQAVGNTLYNKKFATPEQAKAVGKLSMSRRQVSDRTVLPKDVAETFSTVASLQREKPEAAMLKVQEATGGGLLSHAVEHAGDLIHRMTEGAKYGTSGKAYVKEKLDKLLTSLTHAYGFEKEHAENLANNQADQQAVDAALKAYVAEHKALPVYNRAQWLARAAAIAVGEMRIKDAVAHLKALKTMVDSADFAKEAFAHRRNADQSLQSYLQPVPGKLIGRQMLNSKKMPDFDLYDLDVDLPGHPKGSTVTQETMAEEGYRIVPSDLITAKESKEAKERGPAFSPQMDLSDTPETRRTLSTTVPRSKRSANDAYTQQWVIGTEDIRASKTHLNALVAAIKSYTMMSGKGGKDAVLDEFKRKAVDNLLWLYDLVPAPIRARAKRWYEGANRLATEWSAQDGYTDKQHAGVLAVLSPQKDWFMNVSLADRLRTIVKERAAFPWSPAMSAWADSYRASAKTADALAAADKFVDAGVRLEGLALENLSDVDAALFVRAYDQTYHERAYRTVTPEGEFTDYVINKQEVERDLFGDIPGVRGAVAWGSQGTIEKAISILRDGSNKNITTQLGNEHKVRNFYNNILEPHSTEGHVTIDTHAMAAAVMKAISANAKEVLHLFGRAGSNAETGASGSYGLIADVYREAARQRNVLPREMQSIAWEAVRGLFPRDQKKTLRPKVDAIWTQVKKGTLTPEQARARIFELAGGVSAFAWEKYTIGLSAAEGGRSFDTKPALTSETTAGGVLNIGLNVNDGSTISAQTALSALKLAGATVVSHRVKMSNTEPTLIVEVAAPLSPEKAAALSATLKQDAIAQRLPDGTGALYGPAADKWGPFNPEYFLGPEGDQPTFAPKTGAQVREALAAALPTTTSPQLARFLLPDGRRLTFSPDVDFKAHYALAQHAGVFLDQVMQSGVVRYAWPGGVELGTALTTKQAETIVDDWAVADRTLTVDVVDSLGSIVNSHEFDVLNEDISPSFLQDWVAFNLEKGDTPRLNPKGTAKLVHYSRETDLTEISPTYHGTGQIGAERLRQQNEGKAYIPRSFFYRAKTKIEPRFKGLTKYQVEVPESSLVDLATLKGTPTERERAAKTAGYKGFYNSESSMPNVVAMFESVPTISGRTAAATVGITHAFMLSGEGLPPVTFVGVEGKQNWHKEVIPHLERLVKQLTGETARFTGYRLNGSMHDPKHFIFGTNGEPVGEFTEWHDKGKFNRIILHDAKTESIFKPGEKSGASSLTEDLRADPLFSPRTWVSQIEKVLDQKMPKKASAAQVKGILSAQNGIKADELTEMGIDEYLASKETFDKHNVMEWVRAHQIQAERVTLAQTTRELTAQEIKGIEDKHAKFIRELEEQVTISRQAKVEAVAIAQAAITANDAPAITRALRVRDAAVMLLRRNEADLANATLARDEELARRSISEDTTQFPSWQLPGGTNYQEVFATLPSVLPEPDFRVDDFIDKMNEKYGVEEIDGITYPKWRRSDLQAEEREELLRLQIEVKVSASRPHGWSLLENANESERAGELIYDVLDPTGRVRATLPHFDAVDYMNGEVAKVSPEWRDGHGAYDTIENPIVRLRTNDRTTTDGKKLLFLEEMQPPHKAEQEKMPSWALKRWREIGLKQALRMAAEGGYDAIGWTTGAMQADRYSLRKHIDRLTVLLGDKQPDGAFLYEVRAYTRDNNLTKRTVTKEELPGLIGDELAAKAIAEVPKSDFAQVTYKDADLAMGGEGLMKVYDQDLVNAANGLWKKYGVKVGSATIPGAGERTPETSYALHPPRVDATVHTLPVTDAMKQVAMEGQPLFAPKPKQPKPAPTWTADQPGKLDAVIRILQDKAIDIKRLTESVQKAGRVIPDQLNPVLAEEMYMKRSEQRAADFTNDELRPFVQQMQLAKVTVEQVDQYLQAHHIITDDVNTRLQTINPDLQGTPEFDRLAGMSDAEAKAILAKASPAMAKLAGLAQKMVEKTRDLMVTYGLESQDRIDEWRKQYQAYVPLHREGFEEAGHPTGTGRSVRGSTAKTRTGSGLAVTNVLANIAQARDQIITRGEKQRPVIAMAGLLMLHPNPEIATLDKPAQITMTNPQTGLPMTVPGNLTNYTVPTIRRFDPVSGTVKTYPDPTYKGRDNVVNFRVDGKDYAIVFNERNERAMEAAKAFKELDTPKLTGIMAAIAPYTRYLASVNTQYNPIFGIVNFVRDAQFAMLALGSTPLAGKKTEVLKNAIQSLSGIYQDARAVRLGRHPSSPTAQMWERFQHVGGPTGYRDLFFSSTDRAEEIRRMLEPNTLEAINSPQKFGKRMEETWLLKVLSDYNTTMENAIRLGVFTTAVQQGMSDLQAASYAKNITVNFNKKGQIGAQMGSLYAFFNANVQGTARIFETIFERTPTGIQLSAAGKKLVAGGLLVGVLQTFALAMAGFGDDEPPEYIKARNLVIPVPGTQKGYLLVPMPLGFNLLPNVGRAAAEAVRAGVEGKEINPLKRGTDLISALYGTFSPLGGTGGPIQELMPTVADPLAAVVSNKDWTGKSISKEDRSTLDPTPGHTRVKDTASLWATALAKGINWATGGTEYRPGAASPTPDMIDYLVEQVTGGIGRELSKGSQLLQSMVTGEELPFYKVPLLGRFAGSAAGSTAVRSTFYDNVKAVNLAYREFEGRAKDRTGDAHEFLRTHPEGRLREAAISVERTIGELNKVKKDLVEQGAPRSMVRLRETQITGLMERFNQMVARQREASNRDR